MITIWSSRIEILLALAIATSLIPIQQILHRTGHSRWWCLLAFVPLVNWIGLWVLAYGRWPTVQSWSWLDKIAESAYSGGEPEHKRVLRNASEEISFHLPST
jgi:predicted PurR-regulated permease PerM